ncbi:hypothetical protein JJJ17_14640 [Paracoccus caeni]|uniref:Nickel/cobalt efflux system n=1 Tax=Paracoccus caeni TaxID=657651 RepID=A0A934SHH4_9RHOB|nr:hypothetical protein [Paracoccus caeni]MBK4217166.1 hypothetical protein [Paracoccus caeni]
MKAARILALIGLAVGLLLVALWYSGALSGLERWAADQQREAQTLMAGALRRLRAGEPGATVALLSICFGYGVVHAIGPGHGKVLIGGYGFGTQVPLARLAGLSIAASLAQSLVAVVLVASGISLLNLSRERLTALSEDHMADLSAILIGCVGLWLIWRGIRQVLVAARPTPAHHHHDDHHHHHHHHDETCGCGHSHGPSVEEVARTRSLRDAVLLIAGIAIRPCTGALFLLILTWRMGIFGQGVAGAFAMGLGTAVVSLAVAGLSVWARRGGMAMLPQEGRFAEMARWLPGVMQLAAGSVVALVAIALLR